MPGPTTILGQRGETAVQMELLRPCPNQGIPVRPFYPIFLGEKSPIFDLAVYLLDGNAKILGPHFYVQVKATRTAANALKCSPRMAKKHVVGAVRYKVPSYFVAVDASSQVAESCYITGLSHNFTKGVYGVPVTNDLANTATRAALYNEVKTHFGAQAYTFSSGI